MAFRVRPVLIGYWSPLIFYYIILILFKKKSSILLLNKKLHCIMIGLLNLPLTRQVQRPGPGFYCTVRAGALLKRLKLKFHFQMQPPTWCND